MDATSFALDQKSEKNICLFSVPTGHKGAAHKGPTDKGLAHNGQAHEGPDHKGHGP